jgi:hypothetical protein
VNTILKLKQWLLGHCDVHEKWSFKEMVLNYFKVIRAFFPRSSQVDKSCDVPWHMLSKRVNDFSHNGTETVAASVINLLVETMSAWKLYKEKREGCQIFHAQKARAFRSRIKGYVMFIGRCNFTVFLF